MSNADKHIGGPSGSEADVQRKKRRSRFGCNTCRARKVKCDERPNGCLNCEKLHLQCSGYDRPAHSATGRPRRGRTLRSCNACRVARTKCTGERPTCAACRDRDVECSYENQHRRQPVERASTVSTQGSVVGGGVAPTSSNSEASPVQNVSRPYDMSRKQTRDGHLPWLTSQELPDPKHIRLLVTYYFQNFHPLRCFAFIHKPSFMRRLDDILGTSLQSNALLHIMCTLGAQFYALEYSDTVHKLPTDFIRQAGGQWARTAQRLLLDNTDTISTEGLMTAQLLYDYALRMAKFTQAFVLSALMARMTQALQINLEYSADLLDESGNGTLSVTTRESRRRLMWSCYVTDVLCGSGVDQLTLIREADLRIQLPCNEWSFLHERPRITRTIQGPTLDFLPPEIVPADPDASMGMLSHFVQQIELRRRVLIYIKHLDTAQLPWQPGSEFAQLDAELRTWYDRLPASLEFTASTIYTRRESSQLGALCLFHCAYHQTMCDLYRIGTPALYKLRSAFRFPADREGFCRRLQWELFKAARTLAAIIAEAERHGPRMIGDTWLPTIAYDSNRIMLFYLTQVTEPVGLSKKDLVVSTIPYLQSNLQALRSMRAMNVVADGLTDAAEAMLQKLGVHSNNILPLPNVILDDPYLALFDKSRQSAPGTPPQTAPDYVLNPLSIFRMARHDIPEGHAPERTATRQGSTGTITALNQPIAPSNNDDNDEDAASMMDVTSEPQQFQQQQQSQPQQPTGGSNLNMYESLEGFGFNLDMFLAPDSTLSWQPAEMVVGSGMDAEGLLPWVGTTQPGDFFFEPQG